MNVNVIYFYRMFSDFSKKRVKNEHLFWDIFKNSLLHFFTNIFYKTGNCFDRQTSISRELLRILRSLLTISSVAARRPRAPSASPPLPPIVR